MDVLYSNLENYDDVNALVELRKENESLKKQLENYAINMEVLQKDFDKVTLEFKRLETNYSSLLKTARAEIERKTQTIVNLNIEKDMLVLKARQNGNRNVFNLNRRHKPFDNNSNSDSESCKGNKKQEKRSKDNCRSHNRDFPNNRKEKSQTTPEDTIASSHTDNTCKQMSTVSEGVGYSDRNSGTKENIEQHKQGVKYSRACSIRNRRQSMPAARFANTPKFSSDEEDHHNAKQGDTYEFNVRKAPDRQNLRNHIDRQSKKLPDISNVEERHYGYHDVPRDNYKSRSSRNYDNDKNRSRDKYDPWKSRRRHSPDRAQWKVSRDYHDDHLHRSEYGRQRHLETPPDKPLEANWLHRSRERNTHREFDSHMVSNCSKNNDSNKNMYYQLDSYQGISHRMTSEVDEEPSSKRPRFNSNSAHHGEYNQRAQETRQNQNVCELLQDEQLGTCQSPDFMHHDLRPEDHITKEIRATAVTKLDDPRVTSKNYIIASENGQASLSTVGGRNFELKPLDKALWDISPEFHIPGPLLHPPSAFHPPSQSNEENIIKEVCMDVDNPVSNLSLESGEIDSQSEMDINVKGMYDNIIENEPIVSCKDSAENYKEEHTSHAVSKRFRIPKLKQCDTEEQPKNESTIQKKAFALKKCYKDGEKTSLSQDLPKHKDKKISQPVTRSDKSHNSNPFKSVNSNKAKNNFENIGKDNQPSALSSREIVAVDLELSDENSDNTLMPHVAPQEPVSDHTIFETNVVEDVNGKKQVVEKVQAKSAKSTKQKDSDKVGKSLPHKNTPNIFKGKEDTSSKKKQKDKKKSSKSKDITTKESTDTSPVLGKKKSKEKEKPKVTKSKICELFGDSSSLITPEDLGVHLPPVEVKLQATNTCVPFFEDAQDAIDVEPINKAQAVHTDKALCNNITSKPSKILKPRIDNKDNTTNKDKGPILIEKANYEPTMLPTAVLAKEPDVVKTVIISTGVQPQCSADVIRKPVQPPVEPNGHVENIRSSALVKNPDLLMKALATSTPHKPYHVEPVSATVHAVPSSDLSDTNTVDSQTDADVPDVRIFVRRRRKVARNT